MNENTSRQIQLFKSLFKGRDDVFAIRWEKGSKSGYMPAYSYDMFRYLAHKAKGGTFQNFNDKTYQPLTDDEIEKHLSGNRLIGIYPLLPDNASWFVAADFDKEKWTDECKIFLTACNEKGIPAYLERSRSGKGGHVWIFFERPYPAIRSRKIITSVLEQSGVFSVFDKGSSFDRLFPNQDFHSGKGLGNLIALPLFKKTLEQGNNCFIDTDTLEPFPDQWRFLKSIKKISITDLDSLYASISNSGSQSQKQINGKLTISLNSEVRISREGLSLALINFLKEELNFANKEFFVKKKIGKNTFGTERYFKFVKEAENDVIIPRGFVGRLIRFCRENNIEHDFRDERKKLNPTLFSFNAQLREHQKAAIDAVSKKDLGIIVAPPGSGKTIVGLKIIAEKQQPALIIVHRIQLVEQWIERIQMFLGIPKNEIGKIGQGKSKAGKQITIATIQSLTKELDKLQSGRSSTAFGTIIVDECHHVPAETYRNTISKLKTFYLYGLTATPFRKYNDGKLILFHLGEVISEIKSDEIAGAKRAKIIVRNTELDIPFNSKTDRFETLSKVLVHDSARNKLILADVKTELSCGKKAVLITERKEHIDTLYQFLKQSFETITLSGDDSESERNSKWKILKEGNYQVLITTGQFFGEGTDLQNANGLFLVYPFSFEGKLIQYIGRVQRSEVAPIIYDYRDYKIDYLNKLFLKRNTYYRKIEKQATLFDEPEEETSPPENSLSIEQKIKIPIEQLDFRYGTIAFKYNIEQIKAEIEFEIENPDIRPEFEVLKPYFSKVLKSRNVTIEVQAEFHNRKLISQLATSADLIKINNEIIEGVKFKFISKNIFGIPPQAINENLLTVSQIQQDGQNQPALYAEGQELLEDILKNKSYKHSKQLKYLAKRHEGTILKIRFVLGPFSLVFLLIGKEQFHIILETLDTEEATYIWHIEKNKQTLKNKLKDIDQQLTAIRMHGREAFLQSKPADFSRIVHDYSNDKKGFIIWKDMLEERLV